VLGTEGLASSMAGRSGQAGKRIAAVAIVAAAAVTLGLSAHHDVQFTASVTTPRWIAEQTAALRQEECLYNAIRAEVPKGAPIYVISPDAYPTQRLSELSTLWAVPQANRADARWRLCLVASGGHCDGVKVEVQRI
jgi:hypothetical protein